MCLFACFSWSSLQFSAAPPPALPAGPPRGATLKTTDVVQQQQRGLRRPLHINNTEQANGKGRTRKEQRRASELNETADLVAKSDESATLDRMRRNKHPLPLRGRGAIWRNQNSVKIAYCHSRSSGRWGGEKNRAICLPACLNGTSFRILNICTLLQNLLHTRKVRT